MMAYILVACLACTETLPDTRPIEIITRTEVSQGRVPAPGTAFVFELIVAPYHNLIPELIVCLIVFDL